MKTYTDAEIEAQFEVNQRELMRRNVRVEWVGEQIRLFTVNNPRAMGIITQGTRAVLKVKLWCVRNNCRCTAIEGGRIQI